MSEPRVIKKYPNRRLYDTVESRYITLDDIRKLVTDKVDFVVIDKKTEEDITRTILLQVISEQEHTGNPMMSQDFLSQVIRAYGGTMQSMAGDYLEQSLKLFTAQQSQIRDRMRSMVGLDPMSTMSNLAQENFRQWTQLQENFLKSMTGGIGRKPDDEAQGD
jgi:polyhydroxyalkanoate synthesis repressor PhaR